MFSKVRIVPLIVMDADYDVVHECISKTSFIVDNVDSEQIIMAGVLSEAEIAYHLRPTGFIPDFFRGPCFSLFCFELCFCALLVFLLCFVCPMLPVSFLYRLFNTSGRYSGLNRCQWC